MKKALCAWRADSGRYDFQIIVSHFCFFSLLCVLFAAGLEGRRRAEDVLHGSELKFSNGEIDGNMAELLWTSCSFDLSQVNDAAEYLEVFAPEETSCTTRIIFRRGRLFTKQNIQNAINIVHPQKWEIILNCLRKNNLLFEISREEASPDNCYTKYVGILRGRPHSPVAFQQYRGRELLQSTAPEPNLNKPSLQPQLLSNKQNDTHTSVVVAVVVTATVTFVFAALLFCCYRRHVIASASHPNDESPLISLNPSDFSIGSSRQSYVYGSSPVNEKLGVSDSSNHKTHSSSDVNLIGSEFLNGSHSETKSSTGPFNMSRDTSAVMHSVKPPTGMDRINSSGHLASKPHSGQIELSSSETSSSLQLPSQIVDKPTPPPPRPPPFPSSSPKPYSGCADLRPPGPPPPPPPPTSPAIRPGPRPQPNVGGPPQPPPLPMGMGPKAAPRMLTLGRKDLLNTAPDDADSAKAKLKPFFWDKVQASPDHSMVWHRIKSGSFQFNEDMIEMLFGCTPGNKDRIVHKKNPSFQDLSSNYVQIIDSKKAQNLSILLRALNVTIEEVCEALNEGNELPVELLEPLLKMAPTTEEELRLRLFGGKFSQLGPAERFLKVLVNIPFAFKRLECLLFMSSFQEDVSFIKESFAILEVACKELRGSRLFLKLLEAVLKTGNRMNNGTFRGGAQAFKLDTLLKLSDVKGTDGKMTLLHFVVQEIIRFEGIRAAKGSLSIKLANLDEHLSQDSEERYRSLGLQVVLSLSTELENVQKAAHVDADDLSRSIVKLVNSVRKARDFLNSDMKNTNENNGFPQHLKTFVEHAENIIAWMLEEEKRIATLVKRTGDYFHGNTGKDEGLRLFAVVRDFLIMLDKVCKEVENSQKKSAKPQKIEVAVVQAGQASSSATLPAITDGQITLR